MSWSSLYFTCLNKMKWRNENGFEHRPHKKNLLKIRNFCWVETEPKTSILAHILFSEHQFTNVTILHSINYERTLGSSLIVYTGCDSKSQAFGSTSWKQRQEAQKSSPSSSSGIWAASSSSACMLATCWASISTSVGARTGASTRERAASLQN